MYAEKFMIFLLLLLKFDSDVHVPSKHKTENICILLVQRDRPNVFDAD